MTSRARYLILENMIEAGLVYVFYLSPFPHWLKDGSLLFYWKDWQWLLKGNPGVLIGLVLVVLASFVTRLILLEIPLRFYVRYKFAKQNPFSIGNMLLRVFSIHSGIYALFLTLCDASGLEIGPRIAVMFYTFSILPALLAPVIVYRWKGALFETVGAKD